MWFCTTICCHRLPWPTATSSAADELERFDGGDVDAGEWLVRVDRCLRARVEDKDLRARQLAEAISCETSRLVGLDER